MANGSRANKRGRTLENSVKDLLAEEYEQVPQKYFLDHCKLGKPIFFSQCDAGQDIYSRNRRVDFILYHPQRWKDCLVIQCKWQASSGTVDQKFPFEVLSIQENKYPTLIVLDGGGYHEGAEDWLKKQSGKGKLLQVLSLGGLNRFQSSGKL